MNLIHRSLRHTLFRSIPPYYGDLGLSVLLPPHEQTAGRFFFTKFTLIQTQVQQEFIRLPHKRPRTMDAARRLPGWFAAAAPV